MWLNWTRIFYLNILHWLKIVKLHFIAATFIKLIIIVSASGDKSDSDDNMIGPAMPPKHSAKAGTIGKENYCVLYSRPTCVTACVILSPLKCSYYQKHPVLVIKLENSCFIFKVLVSKSRSSVHLKLNTSLFLLSIMDQLQIGGFLMVKI